MPVLGSTPHWVPVARAPPCALAPALAEAPALAPSALESWGSPSCIQAERDPPRSTAVRTRITRDIGDRRAATAKFLEPCRTRARAKHIESAPKPAVPGARPAARGACYTAQSCESAAGHWS